MKLIRESETKPVKIVNVGEFVIKKLKHREMLRIKDLDVMINAETRKRIVNTDRQRLRRMAIATVDVPYSNIQDLYGTSYNKLPEEKKMELMGDLPTEIGEALELEIIMYNFPNHEEVKKLRPSS